MSKPDIPMPWCDRCQCYHSAKAEHIARPPYVRVIPRDLFNEANVLKCLGKFWIETERHGDVVTVEHDGAPFDIEQDDDGALSCANVQVKIGGVRCHLWRPLNSREAWPLYLQIGEADESVDVFTDAGNLTADAMDLIEAARARQLQKPTGDTTP